MKDFGSRLKAVRMTILGMSREEFSDRFGVPLITLRSWETGKTKINPTSLNKLVRTLSSEKISISENWLTSGEGLSPFSPKYEFKTGMSEKDIFLSSNPGSIIFEIKDSEYEPFLEPGDILGATQIQTQMAKSHNISLIEINGKSIQIVKILVSEDEQLIFIPIKKSSPKKPIIYKSGIKIYKIIWFKAEKYHIF